MPIIFECPNCNAKMRAPDGSAGKQARCPTCSQLVTIGAASAPPPPPPAPTPEEDEPRRGVRERPEAPASRRRDEDVDEPRERGGRERGSRDEDEDDRPSRRRDEDEDDRPRRRRDEDEDGGRSVRRRKPQEEPGFSIASLVLGCVAFIPCVCGVYGIPVTAICAIMAIVFGIIGQKKGGKGMALAGIICGAIALALDALIVLFVLILGATMLTFGGR